MNSRTFQELSNHIFRKYLANLDKGSLITIHDSDYSTASELVELCRALVVQHDVDCSIFVLTTGKTLKNCDVRPDKAVELRNTGRSLILFIPTEIDGVLGSVQGFTNIRLIEEIEEVTNDLIVSAKEFDIPNVDTRVKRHASDLVGHTALLDFLVEVCNSENPREEFASNLWKIGLIPDTREHCDEESLINNLKATNAIISLRFPFRNLDQRLDFAGISNGAFRESLRTFLSVQNFKSRDWLREISNIQDSRFYFDKWIFDSGTYSTLDGLEVRSFIKNGKLDKASKLELHPTTQEFISRGQVQVEWIPTPLNVKEEFVWFVEVCVATHDDSGEVLLSTRVSRNIKKKKIDLHELDQYNNVSLRVRLSAIDNFGTTLKLTNGKDALANSEDFVLDIEGEEPGGEPHFRRVNASSFPEGILFTALEDKNFDSLDSKFYRRYVDDAQMYEGILGNRWTRVRVSSYVKNASDLIASEGTKVRIYRDSFLNGEIRTSPRFEQTDELEIPTSVKNARANFFLSLRQEIKGQSSDPLSGKGDLSIEAIFWTEELIGRLYEYVQVYGEELGKNNKSTVEALLRIDQVELSIDSPNGNIQATLVLPIHPIRALWICQHQLYVFELLSKLIKKSFSERKKNFDSSLVTKLEPTNLPFCTLGTNGLMLYAKELLFGTGIYLPTDNPDKLESISIINRALGLSIGLQTKEKTQDRINKHIYRYVKSNDFVPGIKIALINGGNGSVLADALQRIFAEPANGENKGRKFEVSTFSDSVPMSESLGALRELQVSRYKDSEVSLDDVFSPEFSLRIQDVNSYSRDTNSHNLTLLHGASSVNLETSQEITKRAVSRRSVLLNGLITYLYTVADESESEIFHITKPTIMGEGTVANIAKIHNEHQNAISGNPFGVALRLEMDPVKRDFIKEIHSRSDWVLTLDRFLGLALYEDILTTSNSGIVVLDYAPDFVDGFGDRLTLTTIKYSEISRVIAKAMKSLGLDDFGIRSTDILRGLCGISGRLAMRLTEDNSMATESVGLFAAYQDLERRGLLKNSIIIPVDSHQDVFSPRNQDTQMTNDRCDMVVIQANEDDWDINLVEVKTRSGRYISDLPFEISRQLQNTYSWIENLLFVDATVRYDLDLQWSRWISLLHFYADRAKIHKRLTSEELETIHNRIEQLAISRKRAKIKKIGYIVSLEADKELQGETNPGIDELVILNERDFQDNGWTTLREGEARGLKTSTILKVERATEALTQNGDQDLLDPDKVKTVKTIRAEDDEERNDDLSEPIKRPNEVTGQQIKSVETTKIRKVTSELGLGPNSKNIVWSIETKGSPHGLIVGISGQGKSHTTKKIISDFSKQGLPCVIFDFHGEMATSKIPGYQPQVVDVSREGLPFNPFAFDYEAGAAVTSACQEIAEILGSIGDLGPIQQATIKNAIKEMYADKGITDARVTELLEAQADLSSELNLPTIEDFSMKLVQIQNQTSGMNAALRLDWFTQFNLFRGSSQSHFNILNSRGYVFDVSNYRHDDVRIAAGAFVLRKLYNDMHSWPQNGELRVAFVLDEAHRLVKDPTIPKIMKEGRKFGVSLLLVSQALTDFAPAVIENAGLRAAFRTNFPNSREVARLLQNRKSGDISERLEALRVGEAIVATQDSVTASLVKMFDIFNE
jgi:hypothetical protein